MLGAIAGDIIGSPYEFTFQNIKNENFPLFCKKSHFTDDTVMTIAVACGIIQSRGDLDKSKDCIIDAMHYYGAMYPFAGYGQKFFFWILKKSRIPYNSFGNGAAMRVSAIAWAFDTLEDVQKYAELSAAVTHSHPEGIKGACAIASAIYLARKGKLQEEIKLYITEKYSYNLSQRIEEIRKNITRSERAEDSVPLAIIAFLHSNNFENAIRKAVSLGGDSDTIAAMCGSIAEAFYGGVPEDIWNECYARLDKPLQEAVTKWILWNTQK